MNMQIQVNSNSVEDLTVPAFSLGEVEAEAVWALGNLASAREDCVALSSREQEERFRGINQASEVALCMR